MKNTSTSANAHTIQSKFKSKQFTQVNWDLLESSLPITDGVFIAYIIGWQDSGKICYETNAVLAKRFKMTVYGIRSLLSRLNKYDFFQSKQTGEKKNRDNFTSTHSITVDVDKLIKWLEQDKLSSDVDTDDSTEDIQEPIQIPANQIEVLKTAEIASLDIDDEDRHEDRFDVYDEELDEVLSDAFTDDSSDDNQKDDKDITNHKEPEFDGVKTVMMMNKDEVMYSVFIERIGYKIEFNELIELVKNQDEEEIVHNTLVEVFEYIVRDESLLKKYNRLMVAA
jgi:hypothetical protein